MKNFFIIYTLLVGSFLISGCKKMIEVNAPIDQLSTPVVFSDDNTANGAIASIYYKLSDLFISRSITLIGSLGSDELLSRNVFENKYVNGAIPTNDATVSFIWASFYNAIYQSNAAIEGLQASPYVSPQLKKQLLGETKFLRAYCYFYLTNLWGDVPLISTTNVTETSIAPRTSQREVFTQIVKDLKEAQTSLPDYYSNAERVRANNFAATALLARVNLYLKNWKGAEVEATKLINAGLYSLLPLQSNTIFKKNSNETILQLWMQNGYAWLGQSFIPATPTGTSNYYLTGSLLNLFEVGDQRKINWLKTFTFQSTQYYYPFKYKLRTPTAGSNAEYTMVLRLSEQFLIRAESFAEQGDMEGGLRDLNKIRQRASLQPISGPLTKIKLLDSIEKERRLELFAEWAHRWLDLKRTGRSERVLSSLKPGWDKHALLWPIPQQELLKNPYLSQNPGY